MHIRYLAEEFTRPPRQGDILWMRYLAPYRRNQHYLDGDLDDLFSHFRGNTITQDLSGAAVYAGSNDQAWIRINLFRAVSDFIVDNCFERPPVPVNGDDAVQKQWIAEWPMMEREYRKVVAWLVAKGRGCIVLEQQLSGDGVAPVLVAKDPSGYLPIVSPTDREKVIGHCYLTWSYKGGLPADTKEQVGDLRRLPAYDIADQVRVDVLITDEDVARSDGWLSGPQNTTQLFEWNTYAGAEGVIGNPITEQMPGRLLGAWTFGNDEATYSNMESLVYHGLICRTAAQTALTRDIRSIIVAPSTQSDMNKNEMGEFVLDARRPLIINDALEGQGELKWGYLTPPGPQMSAQFINLWNMILDELAYTAHVSRQAWGDDYVGGEPGVGVDAMQRNSAVFIGDIRTSLQIIISQQWALQSGHDDPDVQWPDPPFTDIEAKYAKLLELYKANAISNEYLLKSLDIPLTALPSAEEKAMMMGGGFPGDQANGNQNGGDNNGRD